MTLDRLGVVASLAVHSTFALALVGVGAASRTKDSLGMVEVDYREVPPALEPEREAEPEPEPPKNPVRITKKTRVVKQPVDLPDAPSGGPPSSDADPGDEATAPLYSVSMEATVDSSSVAVPVAPRGARRAPEANKVTAPAGAGRATRSVTSLPRVLYQERAAYPRAAREAGIEGRVIVLIAIDASGKVTALRVVKGLGHGLDAAAKAALRRFKFTPGTVNNQATPMEIRYTYTFRLDD